MSLTIKLNVLMPHNPEVLLLGILPKKLTHCLSRNTQNVQSTDCWLYKKLETTQMSTARRRNNKIVIYSPMECYITVKRKMNEV